MFWTGGFRPKKQSIEVDGIPVWEDDSKLHTQVQKSTAPQFRIDTEINHKISFLMHGEIASILADAIVISAEDDLSSNGRSCELAYETAGPELISECKRIGHCEIGNIVVTNGFNLPSKYIIHAVGPIGEQPEILKKVYNLALQQINGESIRTIAFSCISAENYGYPILPAAKIALETVREFLNMPTNLEKTDRIIFVIRDSQNIKAYNQIIWDYFPIDEYLQINEEETTAELPATFQKITGSIPCNIPQIYPQPTRDTIIQESI